MVVIFNLDNSVKAVSFGRVLQKTGAWHNGRTTGQHIVLYCTDGFVNMNIGGETYRIGRGDVALIPKGTFYRPMEGENFRYYFFHFEIDERPKSQSEIKTPETVAAVRHTDIHIGDIAYSFDTDYTSHITIPIYSKDVLTKVKGIFENALTLHPEFDFSDKLRLDNCVREILVELGAKRVAKRFPKKLAEIVEYIGENYTGELNLGILSEKFGMSQSYISRLFHSFLHQKPSKYINSVRVSAAASLLLDTEEKICDIAQKVGYSDIYYFSKVFASVKGISPGKFRNGAVYTNK